MFKNPAYRISPGILFLEVLIVTLSSCIKEEFNADVLNPSVRISPGVAAPIGFVHYRIEELFTDSIIPEEFTVDEDGFITMKYKEEIASASAVDIFTFDDISYGVNISNNSGAPIILDNIPPGSSLTLEDTIHIPFNIPSAPGAEVDSIIVDSMEFSYSATSNLDGLVTIYGPFSSGIQLNGGNVSQTITDITIRLEHIAPNRNELSIVYQVTLLPGTGTITAGGTIADLSIQLSNIDYTSVYGYMGQFNIPIPNQMLDLGLYDPIESGIFHFEDASLTLGTSNSFGVPVEVEMTNFQTTGRDGQVSFITGSTVPSSTNPWLINYPLTGQEGLEIQDSIVLTTDNSNLFTVLETAPVELLFGASGTCNPGGVNHSNFLLDTSQITLSASLVLPMYGYADLVLMRDTLDFVFNDFYDNPPEEIKSLTFRLNFTNGLPVDVNIQCYFVDDSGVILDSLFTDLQDPLRLVPGATDTDGDGKADPLKADPVEIVLDQDRIDNISDTRHIIVYGRFSTVDIPQNVRFYTDYFFTAYLGAIAELDVNSSNF